MCQTLYLGSRFEKVSKGGPHLSVNMDSARDNKSKLHSQGFIATVVARQRGVQGRGAQLHGWVKRATWSGSFLGGRGVNYGQDGMNV